MTLREFTGIHGMPTTEPFPKLPEKFLRTSSERYPARPIIDANRREQPAVADCSHRINRVGYRLLPTDYKLMFVTRGGILGELGVIYCRYVALLS